MTYKENIRAILECHFSGFKEEIIESACNRILEQEERDIKTGHSCKDFTCLLCGCKFYPVDIVFGDYNYCPNCSAKMKK